MSVSRKALLDFKDTDFGSVTVAELGGDVRIATLTALEADRIREMPEGIPSNVFITILGACDDDGERLFNDKDAPALGKKPSRMLTTIANAVLRHNGLLAESADEVKNASGETESDGSASGSPSPLDEA
jgi:hypothetical protein